MFFPIIPDVGIDIDQIVVVEKEEQELTEAQMQEKLIVFSKALFAGNQSWAKWGQKHPEDIPRYKAWFRAAVPLQRMVIPSMSFDFAHMSLEYVRVRFLMIEGVTMQLILAVPSETPI